MSWADDEALVEAVARGLHDRAIRERQAFSSVKEAGKFRLDWESLPDSTRWGWHREARIVLGDEEAAEEKAAESAP